MTKTKIVLCLFAAMPVHAAIAAPQATQEGADALAATFERYVGHPPAGEASAVTVLPQGTSYRASFDLKRLTRALEGFGGSIEPATSAYMLTPRDDGTWQVVSDGFPTLVMHFGPQTLTLKSDSTTFDGTFDPRIPGFSDATTVQSGSDMSQTAPNVTRDRHFDQVTTTQKAAPAEGGTATGSMTYVAKGLTSTLVFKDKLPQGSPGENSAVVPQPSTTIGYSAPGTALDLSFDKLHLKDVLDVWAFLVAHPDRNSAADGQGELKGLLRNALPLLAALKESGSVDQIAITTPVGPFAAKKLAGALGFSNLAAIGEATMGLSFEALSVPSDNLPPWSLGLIPHAVDLHPAVSGFHFAEAAREALDDLDLKAGKGNEFTPAQKERIAHLAWPGDGKVTLAPSRITSDLLDLHMDGEATFGSGSSSGRLSVTGTGLDKAIAALQAASGTDPVAAQVLTPFVTAKNLAKPNPDGSLTWVVVASESGPLTINGVPLK